MEPHLVVLNDVLVVGTPLVVLHVPSPHDLPILGLQQILHLRLHSLVLLTEPPLKETHFAVEERAVGLLGGVGPGIPESLATGEHIVG